MVLAGVILALCGEKVAHLPFWAALAGLREGTGSRADPVLGLGFGDQPCRSGVWFPKCKVSVGLAGVIRVVSCAGRLVHLPVWANGSRGCSTSALGW